MIPNDLSFAEFYAAYLADHRHPLNRALHLIAKLLAVAGLIAAARQRSLLPLLAAPLLAVAPCWIGHFLFERNRPASWAQPSTSLLGTLAGWFRRLAPRPRGQPGPPLPRPHPSGGRAYYSFLADLRMCGEMLVPWRASHSRDGERTRAEINERT